MSIPSDVSSNFIEVNNTRLHYLEAGSGEAVLLIHGWPTSAYLWRNMIGPLAANKRVIALDLPGFGKSDKPLDASYKFHYYEEMIGGFLNKLQISNVNLVVHDFGGPVGLMWAIHNQQKITRLVFLNTLVYTPASWAVTLFMLASVTPFVRKWMVSSSGISTAMRLGVKKKKNLTPEILKNYWEPFQGKEAKKLLFKPVQRLNPAKMKEIAEKLPEFKIPVRLIYGENDLALPDIAKTMARLKKDLPQAQMTSLPHCGHFLQEDEAEKISELLLEFFEK